MALWFTCFVIKQLQLVYLDHKPVCKEAGTVTMLLLPGIVLALMLALEGQYVDGNQFEKIVQVSGYDDNSYSSGSGESDNNSICCVYGNCTCNSLDHALENLASNVLINITTNAMLSSLINVSESENVSIIGHNNPTVFFKNGGEIHFTSCHNCIIQGITWDECDTENIDDQTEPGLMFTNSSNIKIHDCSFQCSLGQAVVLSEVSGDVHISNCSFVNNSRYRGHGAAIHYSSHGTTDSHFVFNISSCNFTHNKGAKSFVYIENRNEHNDVTFVDSIFHDNEGVCIFLVNQKFCFKGNTSFENNKGKQGTGLYISDNSTVVFGENSDVLFIHNSANTSGGAIFVTNHSRLLFDQTSDATFSNNTATKYGAAIYSHDNSQIVFTGNSNVTFNNNGKGVIPHYDSYYVHIYGIIYMKKHACITFEGNSTTEFSNNEANRGGAIQSHDNSYISFKENSTTIFRSNIANDHGGAIYSYDNSYISFEGNSTTMFSSNNADYFGGAICSYDNSYISFKENSTTMFSGNIADYFGGAIDSFDNSYISFEENSKTMLSNNTADYGGAIDSYGNSYISFEGNSAISFSNNSADSGGAIASFYDSYTSFKEDSTTVFSNNIAAHHGAAVCAKIHSDITFDNNSQITFTNNKATDGTTIYSVINSKIITKGDSSVVFNDVSAKWCNNKCSHHYYSEPNVITIDSSGIVQCSYQEGFICRKDICQCNEFERNFENNSVINITNTVMLSSNVLFNNLSNILFIGYNNPSVYCINGSGLTLMYSKNIVLKGITWIGCGSNINNTNSSNIHSEMRSSEQNSILMNPVIHLQFSLNISIQNCSFLHSKGPAVVLSQVSGETNITHCKFVNSSSYSDHGTAIHYTLNDKASLFTISDCSFAYNDAKSLVYLENRIYRYIQNHKITICNSNFYHNQAVSIHVVNHNLTLSGNILFRNNNAGNGTGIYITDSSVVIFGENSNASFIQNVGGGAIQSRNHSTILFDQNSKATFHDNKATSGTIYSENNSNVIFRATSKVTFSSNLAIQCGAAIHSFDNSQVKFTGNAEIIFNDNVVHFSDYNKQLGGTVFSENNSHVSFEGNSIAMFSNNTASFGAAIFLLYNSNVNFKDSSRTTFNDNTANNYGGAIALYDNCTATIEQHSNLTFTDNIASQCGGALHFSHHCNISFTDSAFTLFANNRAEGYGKAVCFNTSSSLKFDKNSIVKFINNTASFGGNIYATDNSVTILTKNSNLIINNNLVRWNYGGQFTGESKDIIIGTNGIVRCSDHKEYYICQYNNCFCKSLKDIPSNSEVIITDAIRLNVTVSLKELSNISLIGYDNSSIHCENEGGLQFISCSNVSITNITWRKIINNERDTSNNITSQIRFNNSSNIIIDYCTFEQSVGQAVVLSEMSGEVNISHCEFVNNRYPLGAHGGAIYYSSNCTESSKIQLMISDCYFTDNAGNSSLIFLENLNNNHWCEPIILKNCNLSKNQLICIYMSSQNLYIKGNVVFDNNEADNGAGIFINDHSNVTFGKGSNITFTENSATINGGAIHMNNWSSVVFENDAHAMFTSNEATKSGGTIYSYNNSGIILKDNSIVSFIYSNAEFGGTLYMEYSGFIETTSLSKLIIHGSKATNGGAIFMQNSSMAVKDNSTIEFLNNKAWADGGCIYIDSNSRHLFSGSSKTEFYNNGAFKGGVIYSCDHSNIELDENSQVWVNHSTAELGGTLYIDKNSFIMTKGKSKLTVNNSKATNGGASYLTQNSSMIATENSTIAFFNNEAEVGGGSIYSTSSSSITFKGNSMINITNNKATNGGAIYSTCDSNIEFVNCSIIIFNSNKAQQNGGCIYIKQSSIQFKETSGMMFVDSVASNGAGGAIFCTENSTISFNSCNVEFFRNSVFNGNGGAISCTNSVAVFEGTSNVVFDSNRATDGGAADFNMNSSLAIRDNVNVTYSKNSATMGGAICCTNSVAVFEGTSDVVFDSNQAIGGGAADFNMNSNLAIRGDVNVTFSNNSATMGGAVNCHGNSYCTFKMNSILMFTRNNAIQNGGAFHLEKDSHIEFKQLAKAHFDRNKAILGGVIYCSHNSSIIFANLSNISLSNNKAEKGGAIFLIDSEILCKNDTLIMFKNNTASQDGGAIYIGDKSRLTFMEDTIVTFSHNSASDYGGAIYGKIVNSTINFGNSSNFSFLHNSARTGSSVYINLPAQCDRTCLNNSVLGIATTVDDIVTSSSKIELYTSNVQKSNGINGTNLQCDIYYIKNIMLGQKILLDACMYDYYSHPIDVARFLLRINDGQGYRLDSNNTLITCNRTFELVSIYGNESATFDILINISLYDNRQSKSKEVMTKLIVELSPCHPGFSYNEKSKMCECYKTTEDIVVCSDSSSTIKRGYWFGKVNGNPTTAFCPFNYCNFTCCETSNGYYHLSPGRQDQCRSHRCGMACGRCSDGYTLSFDSTKCVDEEHCTAGHTALVVLLSILYWIVMVMLVFAMMYYKVGVGYLYGITYYYSVVDILLNENLYASRGLYLTVIIMSSFSKIIPQFLGELCFTTGMSGIDQQIIHYIHPAAIILILGMIILSARISQRVSVIISRGIIHVICLLLLLSYTSIASTSLLLMRPLKFDKIDALYTYLSPDIEYFHDRHLAYGIVALLCMVSIAIGLPLLLVLEPFLNRKFNFIKIKPLLDQFQGCYKDKYRCFAGYYMICRLVIITIVIIDSSNDFLANFLLITTSGIIVLIHLLIKPYNSSILNKLDGIILQLIVFIKALTLLDDFDSPLVVTFSFMLVILPLVIIIGTAIFFHKDDIKKLFVYFTSRITSHSSNDVDNNDMPMREYNLVIGNTMRANATICDM